MTTLTWLWYLGAGFLLGWVTSTLVEWLWFRRRRLQQPAQRFSTRETSQAVFAQERRRIADPNGEAWADTPDPEPAPRAEPTAIRSASASPRPVKSEQQEEDRTSVAGSSPAGEAALYPDPLTQIRGIGVVFEKRLYNAGIFTWHQLANTDPETLRVTTNAHSTRDPEIWIEQAQRLAEQHGRVGAIYRGPVPDDFMRIDGIDSVYERALYQAGIYTYAQLAALSAQELARILPHTDVGGEEEDYAIWIEQARQLSQAA